MNKKLTISLGVIGIIAAVAIGATVAYFNDIETSSGNILTAGTLNLKVDHIKQTYNDADCKTCSVEIKSDTSNVVTGTVGGSDPVPFPHAAVQVSNPHPAWTVTGDIPGATWIWATDPTLQADTTQDVYYTFEKTFEWWGPVNGVVLSLGVGTDNGYEIKLNGYIVGTDWTEYNYQSPADVYTNFGGYIVQGTNVLSIEVKNKALPGGTPSTNPAGLLYKLVIDGQCDNDYFKTHCQLWGLKDLENEKFFDFDDVKPGDRGTNVISLHAYDNDGWVCLMLENKFDDENQVVDPEAALGDLGQPGELSKYLKVFLWRDADGDGIYEPSTETAIGTYGLDTIGAAPVYDSTTGTGSLPASNTKYVGLAWCAGSINVDGSTGAISCNGAAMLNDAQTDKFIADLVLYAEQWRNNPNFKCSDLVPNLVNGGFETGDFTGWALTGPGTVVGSYVSDQGTTYLPKEGNYFAVLDAGLGAGIYTVVSQQVALKSGQKLAGWAAFDAKDYVPFDDDSAVVIVSGGPLATPWSAKISDPDVGNYGETDWEYWSWTALAGGTYTLELKVENVGDNILNSTALFDANVVIP